MKWIGQHIYDLVARFRNDIYLEGISTSTETDMLVVDSNNKVSKRAIDAITVDVSDFMSSGVNNGILTATGADAMQAETYLTFVNTGNVSTLSLLSDQDTGDYFTMATTTHGATTLTTEDDDAAAAHFEVAADGNITLDAAGDIALEAAGGDITGDADNYSFTSSSSGKPLLTLESTNTTADASAELKFLKDAADTVDGEYLGKISWYGDNDAGTPEEIKYAGITVRTTDVSDGTERGSMYLQVAEYDGGLNTGLSLTGTDTNGEIDATIGRGAASVTTVSGTLTMGSTATLNNTGEIQVASQPNITTLAGLTSLGVAGATTDIAAGDLTMYNPVTNGNPTISLGKDANDRFEIKALYNSGAQTLDQVYFTSYTTSSTAHDGRYLFYVDEVELVKIADNGLFVTGGERLQVQADDATLVALDFTASSATQGGKLRLMSGDGAAMADNHRLGIIQFEGAEDASGTYTVGAQIEAFAEAGWSASENGGRMVFSTTDGNASISEVLRLDSNKLSTFSGDLNAKKITTTHDYDTTTFENQLADNEGSGEILRYGSAQAGAIGTLHFLHTDNSWDATDADAVATGASQLLGIAINTDPGDHGMLLDGYYKVASGNIEGTPAVGAPVYVSEEPGKFDFTAPSATADFVRIVGYCIDIDSSDILLRFKPDNTWVEIG